MTFEGNVAARLQDVTKRFGRAIALDGLTAAVPAGQVVGLIGPNGAGKSTLLRLIAGLQRPTSGTVEVLGQRPGLATKARVAYVPDGDFLDGWMTIAEAVAFWAQVFPEFDRDRAWELIETLELKAERRISGLSRGQRLRAGLALALARRADLYLFDEPLAHIDPRSRKLMIDVLLATEFSAGATMLLATHQVAEVERLLEHAIFIAGGRVTLAGEADSLRAQTGRSLLELAEEVVEP